MSSAFVTGDGNVTVVNGGTVSVGGGAPVPVYRVILERADGSRERLPGEYSSVDLRVSGDCRDVSLPVGTVRVAGGARAVKTMSGDVRVKGGVAGAVHTMSGDVTVHGNCRAASSMSGNVTHGGR